MCDALGERVQVVAAVAAALGTMPARACLAKVFSACGSMLGPSRSSAPFARSASARAWSRMALSYLDDPRRSGRVVAG
jgi:hypothetical protein